MVHFADRQIIQLQRILLPTCSEYSDVSPMPHDIFSTRSELSVAINQRFGRRDLMFYIKIKLFCPILPQQYSVVLFFQAFIFKR